jgi:hypothetical protein
MKDTLNSFRNGRQPHFFHYWKTIFIDNFEKNDVIFRKGKTMTFAIKDDIFFFENERRPQIVGVQKTTSVHIQFNKKNEVVFCTPTICGRLSFSEKRGWYLGKLRTTSISFSTESSFLKDRACFCKTCTHTNIHTHTGCEKIFICRFLMLKMLLPSSAQS